MKNIYLIVICIASLAGCAGGPGNLEERHTPTGITSFDYSNKEFKEYIAYRKEAHEKYNILSRTKIELDNIAPFQIKSERYDECKNTDRVGVLIIHGLTDTPYLMKDIANGLIKQNHCVLARSVILPGHGTVPGDLLNVHHDEWIEATKYGIDSFPNSGVNNIFIAAYSTGAAAALDYADNAYNENSNLKLKGLMLFSPAIRIKPIGGFLSNWHKTISWLLPDRAWFDIMKDSDFAKYESFPKNAADQIYLLTKKISLDKNEKIPTPMFVVISNDDDTIDSEKTKSFFNDRSDDLSKMLVYKVGAKNKACKDKICERRSDYVDRNIFSFSHTAIPISPSNYHYGKKQKYKSCYHYLGKDDSKYNKCMVNGEGDYKLGEKSISKTDAVRRLTYNPDFDYMTTYMNEFFSALR
jgi:esterase/lipase